LNSKNLEILRKTKYLLMARILQLPMNGNQNFVKSEKEEIIKVFSDSIVKDSKKNGCKELSLTSRKK